MRGQYRKALGKELPWLGCRLALALFLPYAPCAGPCAEEMGCHGTQYGQPGLELVTELEGEAGAEPLPWGGGGKWHQELGWVDAYPFAGGFAAG